MPPSRKCRRRVPLHAGYGGPGLAATLPNPGAVPAVSWVLQQLGSAAGEAAPALPATSPCTTSCCSPAPPRSIHNRDRAGHGLMAAGRKGWARDLHTRELTGASFPLQAPRAHTGVLVLDEAVRLLRWRCPCCTRLHRRHTPPPPPLPLLCRSTPRCRAASSTTWRAQFIISIQGGYRPPACETLVRGHRLPGAAACRSTIGGGWRRLGDEKP